MPSERSESRQRVSVALDEACLSPQAEQLILSLTKPISPGGSVNDQPKVGQKPINSLSLF